MSKRGINSGAVVFEDIAVVSHGEENLDSSEMGLLTALDARSRGEIAREGALWEARGFLGGFSSGVGDGDLLYQLDNGANLHAFSARDGEQLWVENLGTIQRAPRRSSPTGSCMWAPRTDGSSSSVRAGRAWKCSTVTCWARQRRRRRSSPRRPSATGWCMWVSSGATYAIGERRPQPDTRRVLPRRRPRARRRAHLVVSPTEGNRGARGGDPADRARLRRAWPSGWKRRPDWNGP